MSNMEFTDWVICTARNPQDVMLGVEETGIKQIDSSFRILIEQLENLIQSLDAGSWESPDLINTVNQEDLFESIYNGLHAHFRMEEELITVRGLPDLELQKRQHELIIKYFQTVYGNFQSRRLNIAQSLRHDVLRKLVQHINNDDKKTFSIRNWMEIVKKAETWDDISCVIKRTGIASIDDEQRSMFESILNLSRYMRECIKLGAGNYDLKSAKSYFDEFYIRMVKHFQFQETMIKHYGIPGLLTHKREHVIFQGSFYKYKEGLLTGSSPINEERQQGMFNWWLNHINNSDYEIFSLDKIGRDIVEGARTVEEVIWLCRDCGLQALDERHVEVVQLCLELGETIERYELADQTRQQNILQVLDQLLALLNTVFNEEYQFMLNNQVPQIQTHDLQHKEFLAKINKMREDISMGRLGLTLFLKDEVLFWWVMHTNNSDYPAYSPFCYQT